ncbi:hypothetical protein TRIP_C21438 [Candidatus Zixiibacteriota bacterium]|nr:hypothetical protein TRIP_C21438 [candidate division Zixibacteria bacterium]
MDKKAALEKEIVELEKKLSRNHFGGLFYQAQQKKDMNRLTKLRKELEKLESNK